MLAGHPREFLLPVFIVSIPIALLSALDSGNDTFSVLLVIYLIASLLVTTFFYGYISIVANELSSESKNDADLANAFNKTVNKYWQLLVVSVVAGIAVVGGIFLLVVPFFYLMTIWFVFIPILVIEDVQYFKSLERSRKLVRGYGWSVFFTVFFTGIAGGVIYIVTSIPDRVMDNSPLLLSWITTTIGDSLTISLVALIIYFAYERLVELKSMAQENTVTDTLPRTSIPPPTSIGPPQT